MDTNKDMILKIENEHINKLISLFNIDTDYYSLSRQFHDICNTLVSFEKSDDFTGFSFRLNAYPSVSGKVNQAISKRYSILNDLLIHKKLNLRSGESRDDRVLYCAAVLLLTFENFKDKNEIPVAVNLEAVDLFKRKTFEQMIRLLKYNLTQSFDEKLYKSKDIVSIFSNGGNIVSELKPWNCEICFYTDQNELLRKFDEAVSVRNSFELKKDLHEKIISYGKKHPLIRLFLKEENIDEQLSLLYSGINIKRVIFRLNETEYGFDYELNSVKIEDVYVAKIVHGIYNKIHKIITDFCSTSECAPIDMENDLSEFAFSEITKGGKTICEINRKLIELLLDKGVFVQKDGSIHFANSYIKWIYLALYLCRNYFNKDNNFIPEEKKANDYRFYSLYENIFQCIKLFISSYITPSDDFLAFGTVFGTAIVSFLNKVRRHQFVLYLCELAKDFSCKSRKDQELAISILCTALNECLDSLEGEVRNEAFKRCYSKSNYSIQQESFDLLIPASRYFENEIKRCFKAYIYRSNDKEVSLKQPYYYFYYHYLFEDEFDKVKKALSHEWSDSWDLNDDELLGIALAIRALSWQNHNWIQSFDFFDNIEEIIRRCVSAIPSECDVEDYAEKRRYALAVESIAFAIANMGMQLSRFRLPEDTADSIRLVQLIMEYDLFLRVNNALYRYYLDNSEFTSIESGPDGLLICGMIRVFSYRQFDLPKIKLENDWKNIFKNERGRFKVLIARTLAYTDFYDSKENRGMLAGIADNLTNRDFLPYDNIDIGLVFNHINEPLEWYS